MTTYTESKEITTKTEYNDCDMIGWSVLDSSPIYRATVTRFSIAEGIISQYVKNC